VRILVQAGRAGEAGTAFLVGADESAPSVRIIRVTRDPLREETIESRWEANRSR
jgi:hypothetical protein